MRVHCKICFSSPSYFKPTAGSSREHIPLDVNLGPDSDALSNDSSVKEKPHEGHRTEYHRVR